MTKKRCYPIALIIGILTRRAYPLPVTVLAAARSRRDTGLPQREVTTTLGGVEL